MSDLSDLGYQGTIRPVELFAYFQVEATLFERGVFALFDEGDNVAFNLAQYFTVVYRIR